ncbi:MAG: phosphoribosyl transferase [Thermoproteota archaeon]|nr:phosphoribosyl transferase [Thermoproteota archaeon]
MRINKTAYILVFGLLGSLAALGYIAANLAMSKIQLAFRDRAAAAEILATILKGHLSDVLSEQKDDVVIIGIVRGGVVIADVLARKLGVDFSILVVRKIGEPVDKEKAVGATTEDGTLYIDQKKVNELQLSNSYLETEVIEVQKAVSTRSNYYRRGLFSKEKNLGDRTVILVDDGIATGATIIAAAQSIRKRGPKRLIIAIPVAPRQILPSLRALADSVQVITSPSADRFATIGHFYQDFAPVTDCRILKILDDRSQHNE